MWTVPMAAFLQITFMRLPAFSLVVSISSTAWWSHFPEMCPLTTTFIGICFAHSLICPTNCFKACGSTHLYQILLVFPNQISMWSCTRISGFVNCPISRMILVMAGLGAPTSPCQVAHLPHLRYRRLWGGFMRRLVVALGDGEGLSGAKAVGEGWRGKPRESRSLPSK